MARNTRNVQYVTRFGWTPVVLTSRGPGDLMDHDALDLVPLEPQRFVRVKSGQGIFVELSRSYAALGSRCARLTRPRRSLHRPNATISMCSAHLPGLWRLQRLVFFPDPEIGWMPFAIAAAVRAHSIVRLDALYSTSSPVSAHLVAGTVKRLTGPWVAEFRDPWVDSPLIQPLPWLHRRLQSRIRPSNVQAEVRPK